VKDVTDMKEEKEDEKKVEKENVTLEIKEK